MKDTTIMGLAFYIAFGVAMTVRIAVEYKDACPAAKVGTPFYVVSTVLWPIVVAVLATQDDDGIMDCPEKKS